MSYDRILVAALAASFLAISPALAQNAPPAALGSYNVDLAQTSVSGLSSGGYMATQYQVAHSASVFGVGVIAGGPDLCGEGGSMAAFTCMKLAPAGAKAAATKSFDKVKTLAGAKLIDPVDSLSTSKVYLFSGKKDTVVSTGAVDAVRDFYKLAGTNNINYDNSIDAGHAFISPQGPNACNANATPYVNKCTVNKEVYDQPYQVLNTLYGPLAPPSPTNGQAIPFDQTAFASPSADLAKTGYVYVPSACQGDAPATCRVHVVFHGCVQSATNQGIGDIVYNKVGYNRWAETNNIIVLYPQVATNVAANPQTCWDWFGYTNAPGEKANHYATIDAPQIKAITAMIQHLGGH